MRPTFAFTLDTELMWGSFDRLTVERFEQRYPDIRGTIRAIIRELDAYGIPTTWAVVGHLFLDRCERDSSGRTHSELVHPAHAWFPGDWLGADPGTDRQRDPLWYGDDIIDAIQASRTTHEIGSHSFSHPIFGDPALTPDVARSDLAECVRVARERGIELRSFAFPRNREGHHQLLREFGFTAFRGVDRTWYRNYPRIAARGAHFLDQGASVPPPVSRPIERLPGLWDIPGSMLLLHRVGARRWLSIHARVRKARSGLQRAIRQGAVFHLWTHPMNMAHDPDAMMAGLRAILREVADLRERGLLEVSTMGEIARQAELERRGAAIAPPAQPVTLVGTPAPAMLARVEPAPPVSPLGMAGIGGGASSRARRLAIIFAALVLALISALGIALLDLVSLFSAVVEFGAFVPRSPEPLPG